MNANVRNKTERYTLMSDYEHLRQILHFPGPDTKLMQNSGKTTFKRTSIDHLMNVLVLCVSFSSTHKEIHRTFNTNTLLLFFC